MVLKFFDFILIHSYIFYWSLFFFVKFIESTFYFIDNLYRKIFSSLINVLSLSSSILFLWFILFFL